YSRHLARWGIEAEEVIANCVPLQLAWAREHNLRPHPLPAALPSGWTRAPLVARLIARSGALLSVLAAQIRQARPDILYLQDLTLIPPYLVRDLKRSVKLVVGQSGTVLPPDSFLQPYDLLLTSLPHYLSRLSAKGLAAEYFRLGLDP